ncbi:glutamine--tRNA ligase/YqeY domain fusion protein [Propionivibrio sp.]|uniref:glutamine--tRNA ligase/YqeY domain fusion protein n=1 Tax=Propionivibrio sp. TaxID=2212460 RepID=UPI0025D5C785|nr:glutamine--tRNA ligase/YqeY domain fusion protein [Propionivibrio sp.]MBK7354874.1 glutamine--tRNA ligase/YqeY domain fusion protein [Propionivibrio sp.]MBK8402243.1 glutamine--tRNA ligase/YqeY domain fusion protein [Propionivibrio sp.]MBK8745932.1 glutamine--tRNA ligase/YqeY domain fusion protein [Propionivibrio sp.]MBK8892699.1 glutamine--tRNA ligase/YqeY domain fusion protein [Propionivibrio sp.]
MSNALKTLSTAAPATNFIRNIIDADLAAGKHAQRRWSGQPGLGDQQQAGDLDAARIRTRFPPEPNGYLHFGHAKSICLNFGLANDYGGRCHLRFDDTNPEKEEKEYVDSIIDAVHWLGFSWQDDVENNLYFASDYFDWMVACAESLIQTGNAYVDSQSADEMRIGRGTLTQAGLDSPCRHRSIEENMDLFRRMQAGEFPDGAYILRAKIDMASPNINLRDPAIYRIRHATHHNTGDKWCVYPMYTFAHPIEDALENITHSICTLEFEDQRPFYDWLLERLAEANLFQRPLPQQIEFSRLNLSYVVLSKRKLIQLVEEKHVNGWDDPRMPTLVGARRRGYTPEGFRLFAERVGVSKSDSLIEYTLLEEAMREVMNETAERRIAVLDPLKLIIDNYPEGQREDCFAPNHPLKPELGKRAMPLGRELWIEREDFMEVPSKGYRRLYPGNRVRLRYGFVVECSGCDKDANGEIIAVHCHYLPDSKSGSPGADNYKVKGNLHWVSVAHGHQADVRLYDRLFSTPAPGGRREGDAPDLERDFLDDLNPDSVVLVKAWLEPSLRLARAEDRFQFERHGYFVADRFDSKDGAPVFNRSVTLKDSLAKNT